MNNLRNIKCLIIVSGKRFSGKDYFSDILEKYLSNLTKLNVKISTCNIRS